MGDILKSIEFLGIPMTIAIIIIGIFLIMQIIGELAECMGKVVPEALKVRKYFARKKREKEETSKTLIEVKQLLSDVNAHYSEDNIAKRNDWIDCVNNKLGVYDASITELDKKMDKNNEITLSLLIEHKRNSILDFAGHVVDDKYPATREQFNRIFKIYSEYEKIIEENNLTNGEIDIAYRIITDAYADRIKERSFVEDIRGY